MRHEHSPAGQRRRRERASPARRGERGVVSSEYIVIAGLMVATIISTMWVFRTQLTTAITNLGCKVSAAVNGTTGGCGGSGTAAAGGGGAPGGSPTTGLTPLRLVAVSPSAPGRRPPAPVGAGSPVAGSPGGPATGAPGGAGNTLPAVPPMPPGFVGTVAGAGAELYWDSGYGTGTSLHTTTARYGQWMGQGWSGGSQMSDRVGAMPPEDALDALAQKHDFAYAVAEEAGKLYGEKEKNRLLALADTIAYYEFQKLLKDPRDWVPPPKDIAKATIYRDRFQPTMYTQARGHNSAMQSAPPPTPQQAAALASAGPMGPAQMQAEVDRRVQAWSVDRGKDMRSRGVWK